MSDDVISMANKLRDATLQTPEQALEDALKDIGELGAFKDGKKILIIGLDETDGKYDVSFIQAGMKMSECLALVEVAKIIFLKEMGWIEDE